MGTRAGHSCACLCATLNQPHTHTTRVQQQPPPLKMRGPGDGEAARPPNVLPPPPAVLPQLSHEPAADGERRGLLGSSSTMAAFDGVERGGRDGGGGASDPHNPTSTSTPSPVLATAVSPAIARKVDRALLPALCTLTLVNYLDR